MTMRYGGLEYTLHYSDTADSIQDRKMEFLHTNLPTDVVCSLVDCTYLFPDQKQSVLDALSPFQVLSKQWVGSVLGHILQDGYMRSPLVFFGAWYGIQHSLLARRIANYGERLSVLIDLDPTACIIAQRLIDRDDWVKPHVENIRVVSGDALNFDLCAFADSVGAEPIVVWTGVEHFDERLVKDYIAENKRAGALYVMQGTDMPAADHTNLIHSCGQLEQYFESDPIYSARLHTGVGDRFLTVCAT